MQGQQQPFNSEVHFDWKKELQNYTKISKKERLHTVESIKWEVVEEIHHSPQYSQELTCPVIEVTISHFEEFLFSFWSGCVSAKFLRRDSLIRV